MVGANTTITTYRMSTASGKDTWSASPTLNGVPVCLFKEQLERAMAIDQNNAHEICRMESDEKLNIQVNDKVVDAESVTYKVHSIDQQKQDYAIGQSTVCILRKQRT